MSATSLMSSRSSSVKKLVVYSSQNVMNLRIFQKYDEKAKTV